MAHILPCMLQHCQEGKRYEAYNKKLGILGDLDITI